MTTDLFIYPSKTQVSPKQGVTEYIISSVVLLSVISSSIALFKNTVKLHTLLLKTYFTVSTTFSVERVKLRKDTASSNHSIGFGFRGKSWLTGCCDKTGSQEECRTLSSPPLLVSSENRQLGLESIAYKHGPIPLNNQIFNAPFPVQTAGRRLDTRVNIHWTISTGTFAFL